MARMPRLALAGQPHLVVQRAGASRSAFVDDLDRRAYLASLADLARDGTVSIHAWALLDDVVLLLATPQRSADLGRFMQRLNRRYVPAFYRRHGGSGALWADRFQAAALDPERHLLSGILLVEQAPVRAGLVAAAVEWPWSSAGHHVGRGMLAWLIEHDAWWGLGNTPFEREARHEVELQCLLPDAQVAALLGAARGGWPLGSARFLALAAQAADRPAQARPRGRPRRTSGENQREI